VKVHLSDGSFYVLHAEVWARAGLSTGSAIDPDLLSTLLTCSEMVFARRRALALLSRAAQTRIGLARKLEARGFSQPAIGHALGHMTRLGYLDDRAFAHAWVEGRLSSRKEGWRALYRGLIGRGIPRALADEVAAELYPPELEADRALQLAAGLSPQAAIRRLTVRGFRSRAIAAAVRSLREKAPPPEAE
jgi:regulatory protein